MIPKADFTNYHIEGYARVALSRPDQGYFDVPLLSHIVDNLWSGGCIQGVPLDETWDSVISLYQEQQFDLHPHTHHWNFGMNDVAATPDLEAIDYVAEVAVTELRHGRKTLIHCQAGLNRSGLVTARVLMLWKGMTADEAISLVREKRSPMVLCNEYFEALLRRIPA